MQEEDLRDILEQLPDTGRIKTSGDWHLSMSCLFAELRHERHRDRRASMTISYGPEQSYVTCFSCGYQKPFVAMLFELNMRVGGLAALALKAQEVESEPVFHVIGEPRKAPPPRIYTELLNKLAARPYSEKAKTLLAEKGVSSHTAKAFQCFYVPKGTVLEIFDKPKEVFSDCLGFPVFSKVDGKFECVGAQARPLEMRPSSQKYFAIFPFLGQQHLFGEKVLELVEGRPLAVVEGPFDTMHLCENRVLSVALMGLNISDAKALKIAKAHPTMTALLLDPDQAAKRRRDKILATMSKYGLNPLIKELTKDPKAYTPKEIQTHFTELLS